MRNYNIITDADSYKLGHYNQYPKDTEAVYSYFEPRLGAKWETIKFFGLQYILKEYLEGVVVTEAMVKEAEELAKYHFMGVEGTFNKEGWMHIINEHGGKLPIRIKAVPEGTVLGIDNVLITVENTDPKCFWLTNFVETLLSRIWYPCAVATKSYEIRKIINSYWKETVDETIPEFLMDFGLHDFGSRGVSSHESAGIGGMAHLVNFRGTDTVHAMIAARDYYKADLDGIAFSVPATEHSVMTARGREGEREVFKQLLKEYTSGILSVVSDSYDINAFTTTIAEEFKDEILAREGKVVFRPDSGNPVQVTLDVLENLGNVFGYTINEKGFKYLNPKVGTLWGDGIDIDGIEKILEAMKVYGWAASNIVFGMGGHLLQVINRDTMRFAFKASAIKRAGEWHDVFKDPVTAKKDSGMFKGSKRGRLALVKRNDEYITFECAEMPANTKDELITVFENGVILKEYTFEEVRRNGEIR